MLWRNQELVLWYSLIAMAFGAGWLLRLCRLYPGQDEPLILDLPGAILAAGYAVLAGWMGDSNGRFLLILCSSLIILPHVIYVYVEKHKERSLRR